MRIIYTVAFILIFTLGGFCTTPPPDPVPGEGDTVEEDNTDQMQMPEEDSLQSDEEQVNKICLFKEDHIISEGVSFSGPNIILEGSDEPEPVVEIIKEKHFWIVGLLKDFSEEKVNPVENGVLVISYEYDGDDYSDWCPEEGDCLVEVVYQGATGDAIYQKEKPRYKYQTWITSSDGYVYTGNLTVQIRFAGQVPDFSGCPGGE